MMPKIRWGVICAVLAAGAGTVRADELTGEVAQNAPPLTRFAASEVRTAPAAAPVSADAVPAVQTPPPVDLAAYGLDIKKLSGDDAAAYRRALVSDGGDYPPEDKAEIWRFVAQDAPALSAVALDRAARWDRYSLDKRAAAAARRKRADASGRARPAEPAAPPAKAEIEWVRLPAGTFYMGTADADLSFPKPVHRVTVKAFDVAKTDVTFKQYRACVAAGACTPAHLSDGECFVYSGKAWVKGKLPAVFQGDDQPVVCVDWDQANAFAEWAGGRLLTEAEWEYAARSGGKDVKYPWGNEEATCERAVMDEGGDGCGRSSTWPVCSKPKGNTDQGLCDMAGNVWVWLQDRFHASYEGAPADGSAWQTPVANVMLDVSKRGGSWRNDAGFMRAAFRGDCSPLHTHDYNGIRVARAAAP